MSKTKLQFLIIDEEFDLHDFFIDTLMSDYNVRVQFANTNSMALEKAKDGRYDVIMYDIGMERSRTGRDFPVVAKLKEFSGEETLLFAMSLCASETGYHSVRDCFHGFLDTRWLPKERIGYLQKKGVKLEKV